MKILQIEHPVPNFDGWKKAFDSDPVGRKAAGVKRYRIMRSLENSNLVQIELEFESHEQAEAMLNSLKKLWAKVEGQVIYSPKARILDLVDALEL